MEVIPKVLAYITRRCLTEIQLLVFEQREPPEDGLQVPGGTVETGEEVVTALWREIAEESGLTDLTLRGCLATALVDSEEGRERRHVFHLEAPASLPDTWTHVVSAGEDDQGMVFAYRWLPLAECAPPLVDGQGDWLHLLIAVRTPPL
jgi:ADP-ribose pyrophosphatase YjhB (NUDIX family)